MCFSIPYAHLVSVSFGLFMFFATLVLRMPSIISPQSLLCIFALIRLIAADCRSTGTDYVDAGGPYCVNSTSTDFFSFGTEFEGCQPSDTQGGTVTPILIDPNTDEFFCSDIATNPDDTEMRSTWYVLLSPRFVPTI